MALQIDREIDETGVTASYWRLENPDPRYTVGAPRVNLTFYGYKTKSDRDAGKNPIRGAQVVKTVRDEQTGSNPETPFSDYFGDTVLKQQGVNIRTQAYQYAKDEMPEFQGATDV